jgi:hypothetical protein
LALDPAPPAAPVSLSDACRRLDTYHGRVNDLLEARGITPLLVGTAKLISEEQFAVIAADHLANPAKVGRPKSAVPSR